MERAAKENFHDVDIDHCVATLLHPETGEIITRYEIFAQYTNPEIRETWHTGFRKKIGRMVQGDKKTKTKGKNCIFVMGHAQIVKMYIEGKIPSYTRIVVNFRP